MDIRTADAQTVSWESRKAAERAAKGATSEEMPGALGRSGARPSRPDARREDPEAGGPGRLDWATIGPAIDKIEEERRNCEPSWRPERPSKPGSRTN